MKPCIRIPGHNSAFPVESTDDPGRKRKEGSITDGFHFHELPRSPKPSDYIRKPPFPVEGRRIPKQDAPLGTGSQKEYPVKYVKNP